METLNDFFLYENDLDSVSEIYEELSRQLKIIHSNNMIVNNINSKSITYDDNLNFEDISSPSNFEADKRNNIISLAKMMIGTYLSLGTGFKDFSSVDDSWFTDNLDNIFETIVIKDFDKEYFESIFVDGNNYYYSDYLDRKRQSESLQGNSNIQAYKKVLRNAGSSLYEEMEEQEEITNSKNSANIHVSFNPLLIALSIAVVTIIIMMIVLIN